MATIITLCLLLVFIQMLQRSCLMFQITINFFSLAPMCSRDFVTQKCVIAWKEKILLNQTKNCMVQQKIPVYFVTWHPVGITGTSPCHDEIKARKRLQKSDFQVGYVQEGCFQSWAGPGGEGLGWMFGDFGGNLIRSLFM